MLHAVTADQRELGSSSLRIASVPSSHVYVRHLSPVVDDLAGARVVRLADPPPPAVRSAQSSWWPPVMLDPAWIAGHADEFDVFHVHFGFDACSPAQLTDVVTALQVAGKPLVVTVHDLRNPHHTDRGLHDAQLDALVPFADEVLTLTLGAARDIHARWGRTATVVPHPNVVEPDMAASIRRNRAARSGPFRVGLHVKSLRAGMDPATILPGLARAVRGLPGAVLQVNGHPDVLEPGGDRFDARLAAVLSDLRDDIDLRVHDYFTDEELWRYLGSIDVSVLPYRHGTHSGWLEACRDLGTSVVAPTCGHYADQGPVHSYVLDESTYDEDSLVAAVRAAHADPAPAADLTWRRRQRDEIAEIHRSLYARLVR